MGSYSVYMHTSPSEKVYIGITKIKPTHRWGRGSRYKQNPHFYAAIQKYGWDQIKHEVLFEGLTREQACEKERELIEQYKATDRRFGYNDKSGGEVGVEFTDDVKKNISASLKKHYLEHPEDKERISNRVKGFKHSEESKRRMSVAKMGSHHIKTDEWKAKIGAANKERFKTDVALREANADRCRANGIKNSMPVVQIDRNGREIRHFDSCNEAARFVSGNGANISACCKGKRKSASGFKWRYATQS